VLAAVDFTTIEVWTKNGLITFYLLVVMELATRRVHFAGATVSPDDPWMKQMARNLTGADDGFLLRKRYLLMDRDTNKKGDQELTQARQVPVSKPLVLRRFLKAAVK
jgi:hypothetical protein